jgi:hypothetical protein
VAIGIILREPWLYKVHGYQDLQNVCFCGNPVIDKYPGSDALPLNSGRSVGTNIRKAKRRGLQRKGHQGILPVGLERTTKTHPGDAVNGPIPTTTGIGIGLAFNRFGCRLQTRLGAPNTQLDKNRPISSPKIRD